MRNIMLTQLTPSIVRVCAPTGWRSLTTTSPVVQLLTTEHPSALGKKSALRTEKQIVSGSAKKSSGYGFGNPVDVDAQRVRVAAGTPPRRRPV
jgi:hypothetical protein